MFASECYNYCSPLLVGMFFFMVYALTKPFSECERGEAYGGSHVRALHAVDASNLSALFRLLGLQDKKKGGQKKQEFQMDVNGVFVFRILFSREGGMKRDYISKRSARRHPDGILPLTS